MKNNTKKEFIIRKPSAMIHASVGKFSIMGQRLIDYFIGITRQEGEKQFYYVPVSQIRKECKFTETNKELQALVKKIQLTYIEYNIFNKDDSTIWGIMPLLVDSEIITTGHEAVLRFSFTPTIKEQILHSEKFYFPLHFDVLLKFKSVYSYILYSNIMDYSNFKFGPPAMSINDLRKIFNVTDKYPEPKQFYYHVIKYAIKEINAKTELFITPVVIKSSDGVTPIKFRFVSDPTKAKEKAKAEPPKESKIPEMPEYLQYLLPCEHQHAGVINILKPHFTRSEYVVTNVMYSLKHASKNFTAYLRKAMEHDYAKDSRESLLSEYHRTSILHFMQNVNNNEIENVHDPNSDDYVLED